MSNKSNFTKDLNKCNGQVSKFIEDFDIQIKKDNEIENKKLSNENNSETIEKENEINKIYLKENEINSNQDNSNEYNKHNDINYDEEIKIINEEKEKEKLNNNFYNDYHSYSLDKEKESNINYNCINHNKNHNCNFNDECNDNNINENFEEDFSTKILNEDNFHLKLNEKDYIGFKDKYKNNTDISNGVIDNKSEMENKTSFMIPDEKNSSSNLKKRGRQKKNIFPKIDEKTKKEKDKVNQLTKNNNNNNNQKINSINKKIFSENVWVHMSCALWIPEVHIEDFDKKENIKCKK